MENFYIPAYTVTNEDWRWAREITRDATSVLTVAGSGDRPDLSFDRGKNS